MSHLARLLTLVSLAPLGCAGHGAVTYQGKVMSAETARHAFVDKPRTDAPPVEGARVVLLMATYEQSTCAEAAQWPDAFLTEPDGNYRREFVFGSMVWTPDHVFLLCVSHPEYEPYEYRAVYEKTPWPEKNGTKPLNVYLRRKPRAVASKQPQRARRE